MQEIVQHKSSGQETHASKKRRVDERVVVAVKIEGTDKRHHRNEGPPSDCWSWRKYGQKPIKGSPYPRGYYRCSTSKGCSAKKRVEISKTDASMLIITYTSNHNHPGPDLSLPKNQKTEQNHINSEQEQKTESILPQEVSDSEDHFQYSQSPFYSTRDHAIIVDREDNNPFHANHQTPGVHHNEHSKLGSRDDAIEFRTRTEQIHVNSEQEQETETILTREISNSEDQFQNNSTTAHAIIVDQEDNNPFQENHQTPGMHYNEHSKLGSRNTIGFSSEENDFFDELEELPTSSFFTAELL